MQTDFNPQNNQQFGMAIHSCETVNNIIKNRIKNVEELKKLDAIIENAKKNDLVDIQLFSNPNSKSISANIFSLKGPMFSKYKSENFFTKVFGGGIIEFINKCSQIADKEAVKINQAKSIANSDVFKKML